MPQPATHSSGAGAGAAGLRHRGLVAFAGGQLEVADGAELPSRICVAPWGVHDTQKGRIVIGSATASQLPGNQRAANFDRVALDFNHNTVPGSEAYRGEPAKVAAHGTPRIVDGEGIVLEDVEWTPEGREYVGGKHYIDLSPTLQLNADGEGVFLHSAAVCRQGAIPGLTLFSADALPPQLTALTSQPQQDYLESMDAKKLLATLLNVPETADDAAFETAAQTFREERTALSAVHKQVTALSAALKPETLALFNSETFKSFDQLPARFEQVLKDVAKLNGLHETAERNEIVRDATVAGKAIPVGVLDGEHKLNNPQLKALCASLPVTVPLDRRTFVALNAATPETLQQNSTELEVFSALGLTKERVEKAGVK